MKSVIKVEQDSNEIWAGRVTEDKVEGYETTVNGYNITNTYETEILNAGFGQGITTTPIQNIQAMTTLTNDGMLLKPYLIYKLF